MVIGKQKSRVREDIYLVNVNVVKVKLFCYIGSVILASNTGLLGSKRIIVTVKEQFSSKRPLLHNKDTSIQNKKLFTINSLFCSVPVYSTMYVGQESERLDAAEMWFWRKSHQNKFSRDEV